MKNLKISSKLSLSFILINAMYIIGIVALLLSYMMSNERLNNMNSEAVKPQIVIGEMREAILRERLEAERLVFLVPDSPQYAQTIQACESERQKALGAISAFLGESLDESGKNIALEIQSYYNNEYSAFIKELIRLSEAADSAAAIALMGNSQAVEDQMDSKLENAVSLLNNRIDLIIYDAQFGLVRLFIVALVVIVLIVFFVIYIIKYMQRTISKKIEALTETANLLAVGNLDIQINSDSTDEIGRLTESFLSIAKSIRVQTETLSSISEGDLTVDIAPRSDCDTMNLAIKKMIGNLNSMFAQISGSTDRVSSGAKQIADGAQSLAQGAIEQTSAVEQVSGAIAGVTQTTQDNFDMAKQAAELVGAVNSNATSGSEQMNKMAQAVQDISIASQAISKVMKTIDDIAFQTNILALNAAVEAARAGQHGKGFAVVADEVRSLASKSAEAAKETGTLIEDSMQKSELGTQIVQEAVKSFEMIASGIHKSADLLTDIARLSEQQNSAIHQINANIDHVAQVAQQNSDTAKKSATYSDELSGQSEILEGLISRFKIKSTDRLANNTNAFSLEQIQQ